MEFEKNDGKVERKFFAIYFSPIFPTKFIWTCRLKTFFKERLIIDMKTYHFLFLAAIFALHARNATTSIQNVSELNLVPFPKEVEMIQGQRFSLKSSLHLHVSAKNRDLGASLLTEMKRAGFLLHHAR